jgi:heme/copper-type cytochrome/quinol oxidase subunit 2
MESSSGLVWVRALARAVLAGLCGLVALAFAGAAAAGESNYDQTLPLVWVLTAISAVGAAVVYAWLVYSVWKYRDPKTKGRRYG